MHDNDTACTNLELRESEFLATPGEGDLYDTLSQHGLPNKSASLILILVVPPRHIRMYMQPLAVSLKEPLAGPVAETPEEPLEKTLKEPLETTLE